MEASKVHQVNPCIRCGQERIKWAERTILINSSKAKITIYVCPDKECQKIVEKELAAKEAKRLSFVNKKRNSFTKKPVVA